MKKIFKLSLLSILGLSLLLGGQTVSLAKSNAQDETMKKVNLYNETVDTFDKEVFEKTFNNEDISYLKDSLNADIDYLDKSVKVTIKTKIQPSNDEELVLYENGKALKVDSNGCIEVAKTTKEISKISQDNEKSADNSNLKNFYNAKISNVNSKECEAVFKISSNDLLTRRDELREEHRKNNCENLSTCNNNEYCNNYCSEDCAYCDNYKAEGSNCNWKTANASEKANSIKNFYYCNCRNSVIGECSGCLNMDSCKYNDGSTFRNNTTNSKNRGQGLGNSKKRGQGHHYKHNNCR